MILNLALSGRFFRGKDYVAHDCGYAIYGFADPMYKIAKVFFGTEDKSFPGARTFLQRIGQWGWGCPDVGYPTTVDVPFCPVGMEENVLRQQRTQNDRVTITKEQFIQWIRRDGELWVHQPEFQGVKWEEYGTRTDFWVSILLNRVQKLRVLEHNRNADPTRVGVVNIRFEHEHDPMAKSSFEHYHVMCSEETARERMEAKGYALTPEADNDKSEQLAKRLDVEMPEDRVIWNDHRPVPAGKKYLTLAEFKAIALAG
jgi:hypothetical protein